ncbi:MAG: selenide, water dikinase SelD [Rhodospirillaceae bacterium]|jgi:selenide, water dikinase|nr:selenide, water dikinase SelD [Rhodospirillaceae bacterium]MBT3626803.1 selenide, water dikinase SelD [Rhodospirillaceae bacterium]MBT3928814.1 selenide, water dikinase SelD [Rhodospirillaceae bacterium]MBT5038846.1 selenide, water dikinase SelD [Rhodospirillaceae bacterium]MBT5677689.1 selenide, water dikinase SelD [Rhodospirillaceae bacterium]
MADNELIRLTELSHGGGCGCKIAPAVLKNILADLPPSFADPALLVGNDSSDDAAVYQIDNGQAVVATTDFFMPIVDDPFDFGRIAATNALSDVYATGARPIMALAIVGMPIDKLPVSVIQKILAGGAAACDAAGIAIAGGHSIDAPEPIYGLAAMGLVAPERIKRNDTAQAGDVLILGKPLGIGILSGALQRGELDDAGYQEMLETTTQLNKIGTALGGLSTVHAMTDVTGFGLLGHLLEMCRGSSLTASLDFSALPILPTARKFAEAGASTGAATRNWASYGHEVHLPENIPAWGQSILCDPQTSGGLLVACASHAVDSVLAMFHDCGFAATVRIGELTAGEAEVRVSSGDSA